MRREYLETAFDEMRQRFGCFGSLDGYFTDGLKIDVATQEQRKVTFTEGGTT